MTTPRLHYSRMPKMICPGCGGPAHGRSTGVNTPLFRVIYYQCQDWRCGCTFVVEMEAVRVNRCSALRVPPLYPLPLSPATHPANDQTGNDTLATPAT